MKNLVDLDSSLCHKISYFLSTEKFTIITQKKYHQFHNQFQDPKAAFDAFVEEMKDSWGMATYSPADGNLKLG